MSSNSMDLVEKDEPSVSVDGILETLSFDDVFLFVKDNICSPGPKLFMS